MKEFCNKEGLTVKNLKELLADIPDETLIYLSMNQEYSWNARGIICDDDLVLITDDSWDNIEKKVEL